MLQEAVASAVHELSQPLNVVNLLADNVLDDVATLEAAGTSDVEVLDGLRRRIESIVEQSERASDITRWVRAFAVGIGMEPMDFDPDPVLVRIKGIFGNDLRVAGVDLVTEPADDRLLVAGNEGLFAFALTESVMWLSRVLPQPATQDLADDMPPRRIRIRRDVDQATQSAVVTIDGDIVAGQPAAGGTTATSDYSDEALKSLPLLAMVRQIPGGDGAVIKGANGSISIRLSLPTVDIPAGLDMDILR
ncbi:MAG: HAMP domain-containing histidine kinase [Alphaproteobacteria bacterium]|nr:HAMP domain-containing histidine kinase [Alphaproteobacteria bacterium]